MLISTLSKADHGRARVIKSFKRVTELSEIIINNKYYYSQQTAHVTALELMPSFMFFVYLEGDSFDGESFHEDLHRRCRLQSVRESIEELTKNAFKFGATVSRVCPKMNGQFAECSIEFCNNAFPVLLNSLQGF